ncbi:MAG: hypothetical protein V2A76_13200 [Planctomycetota bacterium]
MKTLWFLLLTTGLSLTGETSDPVELNRQALELLEKSEFDQAIQLLDQAVRESGRDATIVRNLAVARNNRGLHHLRQAEYSRAILDFAAACSLDETDDALFEVHLGYAYLLSRDFGRAEAALRHALSKYPQEPKVYDFLGFLHYTRDELEEAVEMYEARIKLEADAWASHQLERARRELAVSAEFVDRSSNDFTLKFLGTHANYKLADDLLAILEAARARVCSDLGHFPQSRTTVLLYSTSDFQKATGAHGWVGGLYDGKIRLPVNDFENQREAVIRTARHEYTHRVLAEMAPSCPIWVNEGLAEWFEEGGSFSHRDIRALVAAGQKPPEFSSMPRSLASQSDVSLVRIQYAASQSFMAFLRDRYGLGAVRAFVLALGRNEELDLALKKNFGGTLGELEELWRREILT